MVASNEDPSRIERIVVLLDSQRAARAALEAAAEFASRRGASLLGLIVEDSDLLRSASLPFGREIGFTSGRIRPMSAADVERRLRQQADEARHLLASLGRRRAVQWDLQISRGHLEAEALSITTPRDLLILARLDWTRNAGLRYGQMTTRLAIAAKCSVMILGSEPHAGNQPILVLYEESNSGDRALANAAAMARETRQELTILLPPSAEVHRERLEETSRRWAQRHMARVSFVRLPSAEATALVLVLRRMGGRILVLSRASYALQSPAGRSLLDEIASPVVVVP